MGCWVACLATCEGLGLVEGGDDDCDDEKLVFGRHLVVVFVVGMWCWLIGLLRWGFVCLSQVDLIIKHG